MSHAAPPYDRTLRANRYHLLLTVGTRAAILVLVRDDEDRQDEVAVLRYEFGVQDWTRWNGAAGTSNPARKENAYAYIHAC